MGIKIQLETLFSLRPIRLSISPAYLSQAAQLIALCHEGTPRDYMDYDQWTAFVAVLEEAQRALSAATEPSLTYASNTRSSMFNIDDAFAHAVTTLIDYCNKYHKRLPIANITDPMNKAKETDSKVMTKTTALKQKEAWKALEGLPEQKVQVAINYSNPAQPQVQLLESYSSLWAILWRFMYDEHFHLTLVQNPHFYSEDSKDTIARDPLPFHTKLGSLPMHEDTLKIYVMVDRVNRIFVNTPKGPVVYGNIWIRETNQIFLKGVNGKLVTASDVMDEGQSVTVHSKPPNSITSGLHTWKQFLAQAADDGRGPEWHVEVSTSSVSHPVEPATANEPAIGNPINNKSQLQLAASQPSEAPQLSPGTRFMRLGTLVTFAKRMKNRIASRQNP